MPVKVMDVFPVLSQARSDIADDVESCCHTDPGRPESVPTIVLHPGHAIPRKDQRRTEPSSIDDLLHEADDVKNPA